MKVKTPQVDLLLLLLIFLTSWYFKGFLQPQLRGPFVIIMTGAVTLIIMRYRNIRMGEIGLSPRKLDRKLFLEAATISLLIFTIQFFGILIIGSIFGTPEQSDAITHQPESLAGFLFDIVFTTWLLIAFGEEFIFRGIILSRLATYLKSLNIRSNWFWASALQAIWFGAAHTGQGISGMLITGIIGFLLGIYFLKNKSKGLWPLVIAHAFVDTAVLTINFISNR